MRNKSKEVRKGSRYITAFSRGFYIAGNNITHQYPTFFDDMCSLDAA